MEVRPLGIKVAPLANTYSCFQPVEEVEPPGGGGSRTNLTSGILYDGNTLSITVGVPFNPLAVLMKRVLDRKV